MLPGCQQPAACLPASGSRQLARQPAGGRGEEGAGTRPRLALGTLTIPLQHLRTIERERERKEEGDVSEKAYASERANEMPTSEREGFRNSERRADRATNYMKETW